MRIKVGISFDFILLIKLISKESVVIIWCMDVWWKWNKSMLLRVLGDCKNLNGCMENVWVINKMFCLSFVFLVNKNYIC